jgi:hypothetical protein
MPILLKIHPNLHLHQKVDGTILSSDFNDARPSVCQLPLKCGLFATKRASGRTYDWNEQICGWKRIMPQYERRNKRQAAEL